MIPVLRIHSRRSLVALSAARFSNVSMNGGRKRKRDNTTSPVLETPVPAAANVGNTFPSDEAMNFVYSVLKNSVAPSIRALSEKIVKTSVAKEITTNKDRPYRSGSNIEYNFQLESLLDDADARIPDVNERLVIAPTAVVIRVHQRVVCSWKELRGCLSHTASSMIDCSSEIQHSTVARYALPNDLTPTICIMILDFDDGELWSCRNAPHDPVLEWTLAESSSDLSTFFSDPSSLFRLPHLSWFLCVVPRLREGEGKCPENKAGTMLNLLTLVQNEFRLSGTHCLGLYRDTTLITEDGTTDDSEARFVTETYAKNFLVGFVKGYVQERLRLKARLSQLGLADVFDD